MDFAYLNKTVLYPRDRYRFISNVRNSMDSNDLIQLLELSNMTPDYPKGKLSILVLIDRSFHRSCYMPCTEIVDENKLTMWVSFLGFQTDVYRFNLTKHPNSKRTNLVNAAFFWAIRTILYYEC